MLTKKAREDDRVGRRAWKLLRMALLWARKGGFFKHGLMMELRDVPKFLKSRLGANASTKSSRLAQIHYFERELSFDKTPLFNLKMHRPPSMRFNIPCLNAPSVLNDNEYEDNHHHFHSSHHFYDEGRKSFLTYTDHADVDDDLDQDGGDDREITLSEDFGGAYEDEAVDRKADEFIVKFYQQMKMQRQVSYLRTVQ